MEKNKKDLIDCLKTHHALLRRSTKILKDQSQTPKDRRRQLLHFLEILKAHLRAEEATLYSCMLDLDRLRLEAQEGEEEHAIADRLGRELEELLQSEPWSTKIAAKAIVLAELIEVHMVREETVFFADLRAEFVSQELEELARQYLEKFEQRLAEAPRQHLAWNGHELPTHLQ